MDQQSEMLPAPIGALLALSDTVRAIMNYPPETFFVPILAIGGGFFEVRRRAVNSAWLRHVTTGVQLYRSYGQSSVGVVLKSMKITTAIVGTLAAGYLTLRGSIALYDHVRRGAETRLTTLKYQVLSFARDRYGWRVQDDSVPRRFEDHAAVHAAPNDASYTLAKHLFGEDFQEVSGKRGDGTTGWYHPRDVLKPVAPLRRTNYLMVNCDYYCHMPDYLVGNHVLMHTILPRKLVYKSAKRLEYFRDNEYVTRMTDGTEWSHRLWRWQPGLISVPTLLGEWIYSISCKRGNGNDCWVLASPVSWAPYSHCAESSPLERLDVRDGEYNRLDYYVDDVPQVELQINGTPTSTVINRELVDCLYTQYISVKPTAFTTGVVKFQLHEDSSDARYAVVYDYLRRSMHREHWTWYSSSGFCPVYSPLGALQPADPTRTASLALKPLFSSGVAPTPDANSSHACVQGRIQAQRNADLPVPGKYWEYAADFRCQLVKTLLNGQDSLTRHTVESVMERQNRPTQVNKQVEGTFLWPTAPDQLTPPVDKAEAFQKREVYSGCKDPRNITTLPMNFQLTYSTYTHSIQVAAKRLEFYAFGRHPRDLSRRVSRLGREHATVAITDYSRWDGRRGQWLWAQWCRIIKQLFPHDWYVLNTLLTDIEDVMISTKFARVRSGYTQLSGSPDTSIANTLLNALINYVSYRDAGLNHGDTWDRLGIYGGDDGLSFGVAGMEPNFRAVAEALGVVLKINVVDTAQPVDFLGRIYLSPSASGSSIRDVPRALASFGVNTSPSTRDNRTSLILKAAANLITDPCTPVLTALCYKVLDLTNAWETDVRLSNRNDISALTMCSEEQDWGGETPIKITRETFQRFADEPIYGPVDATLADYVMAAFMPNWGRIEQAIAEARTLDDLPAFMGQEHPYLITEGYAIDGVVFGRFPEPNPRPVVKFKTDRVAPVAAIVSPGKQEISLQSESLPAPAAPPLPTTQPPKRHAKKKKAKAETAEPEGPADQSKPTADSKSKGNRKAASRAKAKAKKAATRARQRGEPALEAKAQPDASPGGT